MACYKVKYGSDDFIDPDYEKLRRNRNLLKLEVDRLNRKNTELSMEIAKNKLKNVTLERLLAAIDDEYTHEPTEFITYLYDVAHHFDNPDENCDDYMGEVTDVLQKRDEYDSILQENCDKDDEF